MMMRSRKPPLARSPVGIRNRRVVQSTPNPMRTPPGSITKSQLPKRAGSNVEEWELRPEYRTISCELRSLAKMVQNDFGRDVNAADNSDSLNAKRSPLFERGRFYEEYSARRNERLKRKNGGSDTGDEKKKPVYDLGVRVESSKKRGEPKVYQSARKSAVASTPVAERRETPRYFLRSSTASKENKKPPLPLPLPISMDKSVGFSERRPAARRARKI
ncbi:uncharacterized protein LOC132628200 [Lycium barbarum]|uniref:uncharacterized protein LOC132628200 n=1 Tax=Lycium barbarum TaxID=112863 RepID=UPI00293ECCF7|nr:uncharacterized protein LOC132628200 [Lycium barbarum]